MNAKKTAKGHGLKTGDKFNVLWDNEAVAVTMDFRTDAPHGPARYMYWIFPDGHSVPTGTTGSRFEIL